MTEPHIDDTHVDPDNLADMIGRWSNDLRILDDCIAASTGIEHAVYTQVRHGIQRSRSKLVTGLNGHPRYALEIEIFDDDPSEDEIARKNLAHRASKFKKARDDL